MPRLCGRIVLLSILLLAPAALHAELKVAMMPSYSQSPNYANAKMGQAISVWGRAWGGTAPYSATLNYGDGSAQATWTGQSESQVNFYLGADHTYSATGSKTVTLTVTDSVGASVSRTAMIRVFSTPTHDQRVNIAIDRGLLWMYKNITDAGDTYRGYWNHPSGGFYIVSCTGFCVLAFEENGHLPGNNDVTDIYAPTARKGLNYLLNNAYSGGMSITAQTSGNPDSNGNGVGKWLYSGTDGTYISAVASLAFVMSQLNATAAQNTTVNAGGGPFAGMTYYNLLIDICDQYNYSQGDDAYRGGYGYTINSSGESRFDGSSQQWINLVLIAAKERWGLTQPQWVIDNALYAYEFLQDDTTGGVGYTGPTGWRNIAKTGGAMGSFTLGGRGVGDPYVNLGLTYIGNYWYAEQSQSGDHAGWPGDFYAMYGVKKGLALLNITTLPSGTYAGRNWYEDLSAWLLGNSSSTAPAGHPYVSDALSAATPRNTDYAFGQQSDGTWIGKGSYVPNDIWYDTPSAVLVLTKAVTKPLPVPIIASIPDQSSLHPAATITLDASASFHMDPSSAIVEYLWDLDSSDGLNWTTPGATGQKPAVSPSWKSTVGTYTITLRVKDNQSPANYATETVTVVVANIDVAPVAVAIPLAQNPAIYTGKLGTVITLDGTGSYDPDGDAITAYKWDLDGNGTYGDSSDAALDISGSAAVGSVARLKYTTPYSGTVGLQVTANGKTSSNTSAVDVYGAANDLAVGAIYADTISSGAATIHVQVQNSSSSAGPLNGVIVRFYRSDPLAGGAIQVGSDYSVDIPLGGTATVNAALTGLSGLSTVFCFVDANNAVQEWDEENNNTSVDVTTTFPVAVAIPSSLSSTAYTGKIGDVITLDGTSSFDPLLGTLTYSWDLDGNGTYGDSTASNPQITITQASSHVGLKVTAGGRTSDASLANVLGAVDDVDFSNLSATITTPGVAATIHITVRNNALSANTLSGIKVRLYNANPLTGSATQLGSDQIVNSLVPGATATVNVPLSGMNNLTMVYCYLDAPDAILEWDENNNVASVNVVNTTPTGLSLSAAALNEGLASGTSVGTFTTTDPDAGDTHTYSLVSGTGSDDNASFTITGSSLKTAAIFDYETKSSYSIRVRTTDAGSLYYEKAFTITVVDVITLPTVDVNTGLSLIRGSSRLVRNTNLRASNTEVSDTAQIVYTLTTAPAHGSLLKRTVNAGSADTFATIAPSATFTQADVDNGKITYSNTGDSSAADAFAFTVTADLGTVGPNTFNVSLTSSESITQTTDGQIPNQATVAVAVSGDGRYVTFQSTATNLSVDDSDATSDIFLLDRMTDQITLVSKSTGGVKGSTDSYAPRISRDGRYIVYYSSASNLVAGDTNAKDDVFRYDRLTGTTIRISVPDSGYPAGGTEGNDDSRFPAISANGNIVAFHSFAGNLIANDIANQQDVFVRDVNVGTTVRISVSSAGVEGDNASIYPALTADGRYVVFQSNARNLVAGDANNFTDIFMHDRTTHLTTRLSLASDGTTEGNGASVYPSISMDGKYVAFQSSANNLVAGDSNSSTDIFVKNVQTGATLRASTATDGTQGNGASSEGRISDDGHYVVFQSNANNLDAALADTNVKSDIFVRDLRDNRTFRVNLTGAGAQATGGDSLKPVISDAGRHVVYLSKATNLRTGANGVDQVYVTSFNDVPTITAIANQNISEDGTTGALAFTVNDAMTDPANLAITVDSSNPALVDQGCILLGGSDSSRTLRLTPLANANGSSTITVTVSDGSLSASRTFTLTVSPQNDAPVSANDSYTVAENGTLNVNSASGVLANDSDVDLNALTVVKLTDPAHGAVTLNANGSFTYTPTSYWNGDDSFTYKANDGQADSAAATVTIHVTAVNYAPAAVNNSYSTAEDTLLTVTAPGVMSNDSDLDPEDAVTAIKVTNPANGVLVFNSDGSFTYMPGLNFNGSDSFTYKINDGHVDSGAATVNITVNAADDAPIAVADAYSMNEDATLTVNAPGVISNDTMVDADTYSVALVNNVKNGTLTLTPSGGNAGKFIYTPKLNFYGQDSFTYTLADGHSVSAPVTVAITVRNVPDAPVAVEDTYTLAKNGPFIVNAENGILANDYDVDGDALNAVLYTTPSFGVLNLNADGSFSYTPQAGFTGIDYFQYAANDDRADSIPVDVFLEVITPSTAPLAQPNSYVMEQGTVLTVTAPGVLVNDSNPLAQPMTAIKVSDPAHGVVVLNANGSFTYTPSANYFGADYFTYKANNGTDGNVADVSITVRMANMSPVVANPIPAQNGVYAAPLSFQFAANTFTTTVNNNPLTYGAKGVPPGLTFDPATRTFSGTPAKAGSYVTVVEAFDAATPSFTAAAYFTFNIAKATPVITLSGLSTTYNGNVKAATATIAEAAVTFTYAYTQNSQAATPRNAGDYDVVATIVDDNYQGSRSGVLSIAKAAATVQLAGLSQTYDGNLKAASASIAEAAVTFTYAYTQNSQSATPRNAGSYDVVATIDDVNYQGSQSGTLVIAKATATVQLAGLSQTYNGNVKAASASIAEAAVTFTYAYTQNGQSATPRNAGSYDVVATIDDVNYQGSQSGTLVIAKATPVITLNGLSLLYNGNVRSVTASIVEAPVVFNYAITQNGQAATPRNAGSYDVVATIVDDNYQGSQSGTLVIGKAAPVITLNGLSATYDGTVKAVTPGIAEASVAFTIVYSQNSQAATPRNAGSYDVVATIVDDNYQGSQSGTLVIAKATPVISLAGLAATYDDTIKAATASIAEASVSFTYAYTQNDQAATPRNAGSYSVVATIVDANYQGSRNGTLVIAKALVTIQLGNLAAIYDGTPKSVTATPSRANLAVDITYDGNPAPPSMGGDHAVVATINDANYQGIATGTLSITKMPATITLGSLSAVYDGTSKAATATTVPPGKTVTFTYDGRASVPADVGSYTVVATIADPSYQGSTSGTLVINKAPVAIAFSGLSATYDGTAKTVTATTTPVGKTVNITYDGSSTAPTAAGSYAIVGTVVDSSYQGTANATLVISKMAATVALSGLSATYDGTAKTVTATTTPAGKTVTLTYDGGPTAPTAVGSYAVAATISDSTYQGSASGTLVISKATATVSLNGLSATYDGTAKTVAATTTPAGKTVILTYDGSPTAPTAAGSYAVAATISDSSYQGSASGTLVIDKVTVTVSLSDLSATYDGTPKAASAATTPSGKNVAMTYNGSSNVPISAGNYAVVATVDEANYQGTASGTLVIGKAAASVLLSGLSATFDGTAKSASATTSPAGKTVAFTYDGNPSAPTSVGSYAVIGTIDDINYQGAASGTFVIGKGAATVALGGLNASYDGTPKLVTATTTPAGKAVTLTYDGGATAPTAVGSYAIVATVNDSSYQGGASGTLVIDKATATIALAGLNATYDGMPKAVVATTVPADKAVTVTYDGSATPPTKAGSYAVVAIIDDASYRGSASGTLVVAKALVTATAANKARTYGAANPEFTIAYSGFVNNETEAGLDTKPAAATTAKTDSPVGSYFITLSGGADDNYSFILVSGNLAVTKAMLIARADAKARPYGADNPALTMSFSGFVNDDTQSVLDVLPSASTIATTTSPAGSYPITLRGGFDNNYKISLVNGILTVGKTVITARADSKTRTYGAANPALTISYGGFINGDTEVTLDTPPTASTTASASSPAGRYPITLGGGLDNNYTIELAPGVLEITRVVLTATAASKARAYGAANPAFTINYTGFVNNDTAASINTEPMASTTATEASPVGNYPITLSGGADDKYAFVLVDGSLAVTKAMLVARANPQTRAFGAANPAFTITYSGFMNNDTESVLDVKPTASTAANAASYAGVYPITLRGGFDNNYKVSLVNGTLTVTGTGSAPVAANDTLGTYKNKKTAMSAAKLKTNDKDPDGDVLTVIAVSALSARGGSVTLVSGSVSYAPPTDYTGPDSFTYTVTDGRGNVAIGTVSVTVYPPTVLTLIYGPAVVDGNVVLRFAGVPGYTYTIEYCASIGSVWQKRVNMTAPTSGDWGSGVFQFSEPVGTAGMGYYRAVYPSY